MSSDHESPGAAIRRVLITGGSGYIGTCLASRLVERGWEVTRLARPGAQFPSLGDLKATEVEMDIREPDAWLKTAAGIDVIVHLAAQTSSSVANADPSADEVANVRPMIQLLETCYREGWKPFILFASTVTVIGIPNQLPVGEDHGYQPLTVYDLHKYVAEEYLKLFCRVGYARGATLRLANVYGPGPRSSRVDRGILNKMIREALAGRPLTVYGDGNWLRDYIYVDDLVNAFAIALDHEEALNGRHWIIGSGKGCTVRDALQLISSRVAKRTGTLPPLKHVESPTELSPIEYRNFVADITGFSKATGWQPAVTLEEGIDRTIDAFLNEKGGSA